MVEGQVLLWENGAGWLVISGGNDALSEVRARVLSRMRPDGDVAYIGTGPDAAEAIMDDMGELGAPAGYLVDILREDDDTIREQLRDVALIVIPTEINERDLLSMLKGAALDAIRDAYRAGAIVFLEGRAGGLLGRLAVDPDGLGFEALDWVRGAYIASNVTSISESDIARDVLATGTARIAVGLDVGSALALGPEGQVETWGAGEVTIALGRGG
jgi:hypothetical protein